MRRANLLKIHTAQICALGFCEVIQERIDVPENVVVALPSDLGHAVTVGDQAAFGILGDYEFRQGLKDALRKLARQTIHHKQAGHSRTPSFQRARIALAYFLSGQKHNYALPSLHT